MHTFRVDKYESYTSVDLIWRKYIEAENEDSARAKVTEQFGEGCYCIMSVANR